MSELHVLQLGHVGVGKEFGSETWLSPAIRVSWRAPWESRVGAEEGKAWLGQGVVSHLWRHQDPSMLLQKEAAQSKGCLALWAWRSWHHQKLIWNRPECQGTTPGPPKSQ